MIKEKVLRVAEALRDGKYREKKITIKQEVSDKGKIKELDRSEELGGLYRVATNGEVAESIMDAKTFDLLHLVKIPDEAPSSEEKAEPAETEEKESGEMQSVTQTAGSKGKGKAKAKSNGKKGNGKAEAKPKTKAAKPKKEPKPKAAKAAKTGNGKKDKPSSGQSGPKIEDMDFEKLNRKEKRLMAALVEAKEPMTITDLAQEAGFNKAEGKTKGNSWTRNSLRRLVRAAFVEKEERGTYKLTALGRRKFSKSAA